MRNLLLIQHNLLRLHILLQCLLHSLAAAFEFQPLMASSQAAQMPGLLLPA